ncbi:hypothetical protein AAG906_014113 [Vitis piasezkii]
MALRLILLLQLAVLVWAMEAAAELALPGCASHCGNISIPYPSGTTPECYLNQDFFINCSSTHQAFLTDSDIDVLSISVSGQLRVLSVANNDPWMTLAKFPISHTRNKFMTMGCDTYAFIEGSSGQRVPTVLDWTIRDEKCDQAKENETSYACKDNSYSYNPDNGPGCRCNCSEGYEENPYLPHGCKGTIS